MIVIMIAILLYFAWLIAEYCLLLRARRGFLHVIHVNGIRGKTSTCRTLDTALRARYKVFTKTTGTDAAMIHVDGSEEKVRRLGPANIREQIRMMLRARREGAEILILECMAVNPVLQKAAQEQIVRGDICVITNVRYDHILDMGETHEEIAESLSSVIPENGLLVSADGRAEEYFAGKCLAKGTELLSIPPAGNASDSVAIARAIAGRLGVTDREFEERLPEIRTDFGAQKAYPVRGADGVPYLFLNLFSVNDPESTARNLADAVEELRPARVFLLYHHRTDRPDRALLFARHFFPHHRGETLFLAGPGLPLPRRLFRDAGVTDIRILDSLDAFPDLPEGSLLAGIGNIKGAAHHLIERLDAATESEGGAS